MGDTKKAPKPPKLPDNAPQELKDFVACTVSSVTIDPARMDWLPQPPLAGAPNVTVEAKGADQVEASVGFGDTAKMKIPISVEGGQLKVDSSDVPDLLGMKKAVDNWAKKLNDAVKGNGKEFDHIEVKDGKVVVTKRAAAGANAGGGGALKSNGAKVAVGAAAVVLLGTGVYAVSNRGNDSSGSVTPIVAEPTSRPTPGPSPAPTATPPVSDQVATADSPAPAAEEHLCVDVVYTVAPGTGSEVWAQGLEEPCNQPPDAYPDVPMPLGVPMGVRYDTTEYVVHEPSPPDFLTGVVGPSQKPWVFDIRGGYTGTILVQSDCSGQLLTGQSSIVPDGPTVVIHPLLQYGPCEVTRMDLEVDSDVDPAVEQISIDLLFGLGPIEFEIGPQELTFDGEIGIPSMFLLDEVPNASWTVLSTLSNQWLPPQCAVSIEPTATPGSWQCDASGLNWTYVLPSNVDALFGAWGAAEVIPPTGTPDDWSRPLFGQTIFPCGPGQVGVTVCRDGAIDLVPPSFTVVSIVLKEPLPVAPDGSTADEPISVDFASSGGADYRIVAEGDHWGIASGIETSARAIIRNDSVTLVVPADELPAENATYVITVVGPDGAVSESGVTPVSGLLPARPPSADTSSTTTPVPTETTSTAEPATTTAVATETPESFFQMVSASIASGDPDFAMERLHPAVISTYSERECRANLEARAAPGYAITVVSVGATGPWTYTPPDKPPTEFTDALSVMVTIPGGTAPVEAHLVTIDGTYRWFTVCA